MSSGRAAYRLQPGLTGSLVLPLGLVVALFYAYLVRLIVLVAQAGYPAQPAFPLNADHVYLFWQFWFGNHGGPAPVLQSMMALNALLTVLLWAQFRGLPRGGPRQRALRLAAYGGAALLLAYLQYALALLATVEPQLRLIVLDPASGRLAVP